MDPFLFEELDYCPTPIGPVSLRRRMELTVKRVVYEVKLGDEFLMSSLFTASEEALARLGLATREGEPLDVVVGGLGAAFFACLSVAIAGLVLRRDRLIGIGQAITMPLFFASNSWYPVDIMPAWLRVISHVNPLSYEVSALRGLLLGLPTDYWLDFGVLFGTAVAGICAAAALLGRLSR